MKKILLFLVLFQCAVFAAENFEFYKSFIESYDLSGKYTHEYNPYILNKARKSYLELENCLIDSEFEVVGHNLIFGYQEEAISPYQTKWFHNAVKDEAIAKNHEGICLPTKNIFGFMTGFLLKDASWLEEKWFKSKTSECLIDHTVDKPLELFSDKAVVFQKHAFGKDFSVIIDFRNDVEKAIYKKNLKLVLESLVSFWSYLYKESSRDGSNEVIGTQDILFSIDYAKSLIQGKTPLNKFFVGPDITYPIEVLTCQKKNDSAHAQRFVKKISSYLKPVENKNTAYIFCSFVDGVGKSTLLNNIKNYQKYKDSFDQYERCDNSSSQESEIYQLKDKVFLVDLPAQMSHFVVKPDGFVFADLTTNKELHKKYKDKLFAFLKNNKDKLEHTFRKIKNGIKNSDKELYEYESSVWQYAQNCNVLNIDKIDWIPFEFDGKYFLFNKEDLSKIRFLTSIDNVHSLGLKTIEAEQMLFSKGISLPMKYQTFLEDLKNKLKNSEVKKVVFVDFMSMYPRSSRENVRINFLLQYLNKIYKNDFQNLFYQNSVYKEQKICHLLNYNFENAVKSLVYETILRWSLLNIIEDKGNKDIRFIRKKELEKEFKYNSDILLNNFDQKINEDIRKRLEIEKKIYSEKFGFDSIYENVLKFSTFPLIAFNDVVVNIFGNLFENDYFKNLWNGLNKKFDIHSKDVGDIIKNNNVEFKVQHKIHSLCKEVEEMRLVLNTIRAQYYATFENLLFSSIESENKFSLKKIRNYVPPFLIKKSKDGYLYILQKKLPILSETNLNLKTPIKYHIIDQNGVKRKWSVLEKVPHCIDWSNPGTFFGIFSYGYYPLDSCNNIITQIFRYYKSSCIDQNKDNTIMPTSILFNMIIKDDLKDLIDSEIRSLKKEDLELIKSSDLRIHTIRLWVRIIATLDMIIKDPKAEIVARKGSKEDFVAAIKLLEMITLPQYYNIKLESPLFDDYGKVEPIISWKSINYSA